MSSDAYNVLDAAAPPMSAEEERAVIARAQAGDAAAVEHMVRVWAPYVQAIAWRYAWHLGDLSAVLDGDDLWQEGAIALVEKAIPKFNASFGVRFSTYATRWVMQRIGRAIIQQGPTLRVPDYVHQAASKVRRERQAMEQRTGRTPEDGELVAAGVVTESDLAAASLAMMQPASLDVPMGEQSYDADNADAPLGDTIMDTRAASVEDQALSAVRVAAMWSIIDAVCTDRERRVLSLRYGRGGGVWMTLEEVGAVLALSRERVRQLERDALERLRRPHIRERLEERSA